MSEIILTGRKTQKKKKKKKKKQRGLATILKQEERANVFQVKAITKEPSRCLENLQYQLDTPGGDMATETCAESASTWNHNELRLPSHLGALRHCPDTAVPCGYPNE